MDKPEDNIYVKFNVIGLKKNRKQHKTVILVATTESATECGTEV